MHICEICGHLIDEITTFYQASYFSFVPKSNTLISKQVCTLLHTLINNKLISFNWIYVYTIQGQELRPTKGENILQCNPNMNTTKEGLRKGQKK